MTQISVYGKRMTTSRWRAPLKLMHEIEEDFQEARTKVHKCRHRSEMKTEKLNWHGFTHLKPHTPLRPHLSGHRANIFSAKFLPCTSDAVAASCAGDSEVRVFDVSRSASRLLREGEGSHLRRVYTCHRDRVKRIALEEGNPWVFLSCSEDGGYGP
ncbi:hypothetical protein BC938DRAFT_473256 [Jimgerdemannia flammicorona]|uniref:WD40-repeat-containing domain protein n=1 Tax=Jimgerdemannia flammicorona TaxID=994334 RepID=A0A433Q4F1_9FUNG|nr:hypothetical protein BC938DRAFT_473256 [Jimgerdemannia flammicorona]